jgi:thiol-disulfide isomerase/thioredoxin
MKFFSALFLSLFFMAAEAGAQGIDFFKGTWPEALEKAKAENKIIFVDAYASWCGPCKRMSNNVFPQPKAGEFYNANFVNMKIDMEKAENVEFASKYPVASYPTLFFIDANGKVVLKEIGAREVESLIEVGKKALGKSSRSEDLQKAYDEGKREPQFLLDYVKALNQAGKPSLKITNEYLATQQDLGSDFNVRFLYEGATEADSRVFDLLLKNREKANVLIGTDMVNSRLEKACKATATKAINFKNEALLTEAKNKLKTALPQRSAKFSYEADVQYYTATKDPKNYLRVTKAYQKAEVKNNAALLNDLAVGIIRSFPTDKACLSQAEKWAKAAAENGGLPDYYMTLASIYRAQGNNPKAISTARKAIEVLGDKDNGMKSKIEYFIQGLE